MLDFSLLRFRGRVTNCRAYKLRSKFERREKISEELKERRVERCGMRRKGGVSKVSLRKEKRGEKRRVI